jgi:hypothetical protein
VLYVVKLKACDLKIITVQQVSEVHRGEDNTAKLLFTMMFMVAWNKRETNKKDNKYLRAALQAALL